MEERIETLAAAGSEIGTQGVPIFIFQEGRNAAVRRAFRLLALKSGGAYFESSIRISPRPSSNFSEQLNAVARLAVGDVEALGRITKDGPTHLCGKGLRPVWEEN
jgi:hypothetical protein